MNVFNTFIKNRTILVLLLSVNSFYCSVLSIKQDIKPSETSGCVAIENVRSRLSCIGKMTRELENIKNSKIVVTSKKKDRLDSQFITVEKSYCLTNQTESEKYLCFESTEKEYDPTMIGKIMTFIQRVGLGFIIGLGTGLFL